MRKRIPGAVKLDDSERDSSADLARKLGRKVLKEIATIASPDSLLPLQGFAV